jgi:RHH-type transcriptional regulator, rel operon repressor / antitoxin RelB
MYGMKTLSIRIDEGIKERWEKLAEAHGLNASQHMREAIVEKLEELEDYYVVKERLSKPYETIPDEEVWRRLGFDDSADEG